jgi:hypothetical protein
MPHSAVVVRAVRCPLSRLPQFFAERYELPDVRVEIISPGTETGNAAAGTGQGRVGVGGCRFAGGPLRRGAA